VVSTGTVVEEGKTGPMTISTIAGVIDELITVDRSTKTQTTLILPLRFIVSLRLL